MPPIPQHSSHPTVPTGIVEGFYGPVWTHAERLWMIRLIASLDMNLYIYAPKEDPFHREKWREPYGPDEMLRFAELAGGCRDHGVVPCFGLSPGLSIVYGSPEERLLVAEKLLSLADVGFEAFALCLDDIPAALQSESDLSGYQGLAHAQAELANEILERLESRLGPEITLLFCPTEYRGTATSPYLQALGRRLASRIEVFWTGPRVVSPTITAADARAFAAAIGRKPILWDNYPVNDFAPNRLFLGPFRGRTPELLDELAGFTANPMNQPRASQVALRTLAEYVKSPATYEPEQAWRRALIATWSQSIEEGAPPELEEAFTLIARELKPSPIDPDIRTALSGAASGERSAVERTEKAASNLLDAALYSPILGEIAGWLSDIVLRCETVRGALDCHAALDAGRIAEALELANRTWSRRRLVGVQHTMATGDEITRAERLLIPCLRREGFLIFERSSASRGNRESGEEVLLDADIPLAAAKPDRPPIILDAGRQIHVARLICAFGQPWNVPYPEGLPTLSVSPDGETFDTLPLTRCADGIGIADVSAHPFRFIAIDAPQAEHFYLLMDPLPAPEISNAQESDTR